MEQTPTNRIAELRKQRKETRAHLAVLCGVGEATIRRWELEETTIPDDQKRLLCTHFDGVTVDFLMGWDRDDTRAAA